MPKRPIGSSQGGKGPMKKYRRVAAKRMNYVPLRWIAKQNRPFRATIPINPSTCLPHEGDVGTTGNYVDPWLRQRSYSV